MWQFALEGIKMRKLNKKERLVNTVEGYVTCYCYGSCYCKCSCILILFNVSSRSSKACENGKTTSAEATKVSNYYDLN